MAKVDAVATGPFGPNANGKRDIYTDAHKLFALLRTPNPVLVDGGACVGTVTAMFLKSWPTSTVHAFEANRDLVVR